MEVLAADDGLVPWWFAAAFWTAFLALVVVVGRDVRRLGGVRAVIAELRRRFDETTEDDQAPDADADDGVDDDGRSDRQ